MGIAKEPRGFKGTFNILESDLIYFQSKIVKNEV